MAAIAPVYRTDTLACPLNPGKLAQVRDLVGRLRTAAVQEAGLQWQMFHRSGWRDFETMARKGWTRPWVQEKTLPAILAQMVMAQVGGALKGYFGNVKNTYTQLVSRSMLPPQVRHQLHSLNRRGLWFATGPVTIQQDLPDETGKLRATTVVIPPEVMALARCVIRRAKVQQLRGWLKTEINRIVNRLVARKRPARIILEALDFRSPTLGKRLNRLISNFGKGILPEKFKELEVQFGIVTEYRPAAYTSQECHSCGYIDKRNRRSQAQFQCLFCNLKQHADVQGARTLVQRRSLGEPGATFVQRRSLLLSRLEAFQARYPRPRGGPADPRWANPYFKGLPFGVRSTDGFGDDPFEVLFAST